MPQKLNDLCPCLAEKNLAISLIDTQELSNLVPKIGNRQNLKLNDQCMLYLNSKGFQNFLQNIIGIFVLEILKFIYCKIFVKFLLPFPDLNSLSSFDVF